MEKTVKETVLAGNAPKPVGPYSQAVKADGWVFASGQIPLDPQTGAMVQADIALQTRRVLDNLAAVLNAAGAGMKDVVKTTVFLTSMADFAAMNEVYSQYFDQSPPARSTIEVSRLPKHSLVEIECVARLPRQAY